MGNSQELVIGLITRPHGIKGEICVTYYADSLFLLKAPLIAYAPDSDEAIEIKVKKHKNAKGHLILTLDGCNDRDRAEELRNYEICIEAHVMQEFLHRQQASTQEGINKEEVYIYQLIDLDVYRKIEDQEESLGILTKVDFMAGKEIWSIQSPKKNEANKEIEILFPAVPEFVESIDIEAKKIVINPPEGLIDLYFE